MDLARESAPDATTLLKFRRLLEDNKLTATIFETINGHLAAKGLMMKGGTVVDATIIAAPSSTKNNEGKRDPEMHQTKKSSLKYSFSSLSEPKSAPWGTDHRRSIPTDH